MDLSGAAHVLQMLLYRPVDLQLHQGMQHWPLASTNAGTDVPISLQV